MQYLDLGLYLLLIPLPPQKKDLAPTRTLQPPGVTDIYTLHPGFWVTRGYAPQVGDSLKQGEQPWDAQKWREQPCTAMRCRAHVTRCTLNTAHCIVHTA